MFSSLFLGGAASSRREETKNTDASTTKGQCLSVVHTVRQNSLQIAFCCCYILSRERKHGKVIIDGTRTSLACLHSSHPLLEKRK